MAGRELLQDGLNSVRLSCQLRLYKRNRMSVASGGIRCFMRKTELTKSWRCERRRGAMRSCLLRRLLAARRELEKQID